MHRRRLPSWLGSAILAITAFVVALALIEGLSSLALLAYDLTLGRNPGLASRAHMQPDSLLGWVNRTNARMPDMFGARVDLNINSRSFRGLEEYDSAVVGTVRVLCSGDSFTFGFGVADDESWCARLEAQNPHLQAVNMAHAGWGVDQAYLFYRREGVRLQHDVHLFAIIPDDVRRMRLTQFVAYPKPLFQIDDGQLVLKNVPVPKPSPLKVWYTYNSNTIMRARTLEFGTRLAARVFKPDGSAYGITDTDVRAILLRLLEDLHRISQQNGSTLVVVLLEERVTANPPAERLQRLLSEELSKRDIAFIDVWSEFRRKPADSLAASFHPRWGHYTAAANDAVAVAVYDRIVVLPEVARRLAELEARNGHKAGQ